MKKKNIHRNKDFGSSKRGATRVRKIDPSFYYEDSSAFKVVKCKTNLQFRKYKLIVKSGDEAMRIAHPEHSQRKNGIDNGILQNHHSPNPMLKSACNTCLGYIKDCDNCGQKIEILNGHPLNYHEGSIHRCGRRRVS